MNKAELVEMMAKHTKLTKTDCKDCLEAFITTVTTALKQKKSVVLTGFGTFTTMKRKKRTGVNPATGKKMEIPAKTVAKFKVGKMLKSVVK
ncbi:MAG: Histone family protein DNA-binding protein [candidate division TM6 bacterium GW2011_GWF2_30_66]|jgi:DNA-binding protein HU-beta|nr:MAG: Histone family protein DNA-binding protein [candidate division TM6 bacterium GW2011_GWF2_30_66]